jgi:hypothetical protein
MRKGRVVELTWKAHRAAALAAHAQEWDRLVSSRGYPSFLDSECVLQAIRHFGCRDGILILGYRDGEPAAAAICTPVGSGRWQTYQPSQLPIAPLVIAKGESLGPVLPGLVRHLPGIPISLGVTRQDPFLVNRPETTIVTETIDYVATAWIETDGAYQGFWEGRGRNLRQNLRKQRRRLEAQGGKLEFSFCDTPSGVASIVREYAMLESAGWKGAEGSAVSLDNAQGRFYADSLHHLATRGKAFALRLALNGRPIAVDFGTVDGGRIVILKTTYDENLKSYSPGQLLHESAFEYLFASGNLRRIEFYGELMDWHARWTDRSRMLFHVNHYRWPLVRRLRSRLKDAIISD